MPMRTTIDGKKNDIRVLCTGPTDSEDAGVVDGIPIDPPDSSPGWVLVDLWVEHDTMQEKGEKGPITRKVNPVFYQVWSRPKSKTRKKRKPRTPKVAPDIQAVKDESEAALVNALVEKPKRVRKPKKAKRRTRGRPRADASTHGPVAAKPLTIAEVAAQEEIPPAN